MTEQLAIVETGILNEAGCPLDFMAVNAKGRRIQLSPFTEDDDCRVIIIPPASKLPQAAKRLLRKHPKYKASLILARKPGCSEYSFQLLSSKSLKPMTLVQTEVSSRGLSLTEDGWYLGREEKISGRQFLQAGRARLPAQLLPTDVIRGTCKFQPAGVGAERHDQIFCEDGKLSATKTKHGYS